MKLVIRCIITSYFLINSLACSQLAYGQSLTGSSKALYSKALSSKEFAQSEAPEILITPNRYSLKQEYNARSVEVIDSEQIKKSNYRNVLDLLRKSTGVDISQSGGLGRAASAFIRGAESDHTLILIDGIRVNDPNVGSFDLADIQLDNIDKIEIVRGASSVSYGSEAIGGVINIITNQNAEGLKFKVLAGSFGTHSEQLSFGHKTKRLSNSFSASYLSSDGLSAASPSTEDDAYENISLSSQHKLKISDDTTLSLNNRAILSKTELDGFEFGVGPVDDLNFEQNRDLFTVGLLLDSRINDTTKFKTEVTYSNERLTGDDPDTEFNNFDIRGENFFASLSLSKKVNSFVNSVLGFDFLNRRGENTDNFNVTRDTASFWTENSVLVKDLFPRELALNLGARVDENNDFGTVFTYSLAVRYNLDSSGSNLHASFGTGFKAPSFNELFFPNFGNPDLAPERSESYDIGLKYVLSEQTNFDVTFFYNDFDNLISFDPSTFLAANISSARARGAEFVFNSNIIPKLDLSLNYVFNDTEDDNTRLSLAQRARHKAGLNLAYQFTENFDAQFSYQLNNNRRDFNGVRIDNFEVANLSLNYQLSEKQRLFVRLDNLFDEDFEEVQGFTVAGFSAFAGLEFKLF